MRPVTHTSASAPSLISACLPASDLPCQQLRGVDVLQQHGARAASADHLHLLPRLRVAERGEEVEDKLHHARHVAEQLGVQQLGIVVLQPWMQHMYMYNVMDIQMVYMQAVLSPALTQHARVVHACRQQLGVKVGHSQRGGKKPFTNRPFKRNAAHKDTFRQHKHGVAM